MCTDINENKRGTNFIIQSKIMCEPSLLHRSNWLVGAVKGYDVSTLITNF